MQEAQFLKKKKLYELLKDMVSGYELEKVHEADYKFYKKAEWLECDAKDGIHSVKCKMYHEGNFLSLDITGQYGHAENERITCHLQEGRWVETYRLSEERKRTEEVKKLLDMLEKDTSSESIETIRQGTRKKGR